MVSGLVNAFDIIRVRIEFPGSVNCKNEGTTKVLVALVKVQLIEDKRAEGEVELEIEQEGLVPVNPMVDGICTRIEELEAKLLLVVKVMLKAMGEDTILISAEILTFESEFAAGVKDKVPDCTP